MAPPKYVLFIILIYIKYSQSLYSEKGYFSYIENVRTLPKVYEAIQKNSNMLIDIADKMSKISRFNNVLPDISTFDTTFVTNTTESSTMTVPNTTEVWSTVDPGETSPKAEPTTVKPSPVLQVGQDCLNHVEAVIQALSERQPWAIKMIDSAGKPPADILGGALIWPGGYDECLAVRGASTINTTSYNVEGRYCLTSVPLPNMPVNALTQQRPAISVGLCLPKICTDTDSKNLINSALLTLSNNSISGLVTCKHPDKSYDTRAIVVLIVISIFIAVMVTGTIYDIVVIQMPRWKEISELSADGLVVEAGNEKTPLIGENRQIHIQKPSSPSGLLGKILLSFSIYSNATKLLSTNQGAGTLAAVNGIRFISMSWVILGHSYAFILSLVDNTLDFMPKMLKRWSFQAICNATVSVDTFFTLSGILLTYLVMKELKKNDGKLNWGKFYFHRFWRLTPPYMLVLMVYVSLFPYTGSGPAWPENGIEHDYCKNSWFYNFLYVNNFVDDLNISCFGWAWYLANDMQFFVISPLIIIPLYYFHAAGVAVILAFLLGTWTATGIMSTKWHLTLSIFDGGAGNMQLYVRPYYRMGPYLVGMYTGYLLYKTQCKYRMNKFVNILGWLVATALALAVLYGTYDDVNNKHPSQEIASLYNTVHRTVWGACVSWVVFSCANGYGGFVNTLLSWKALIPLSRLTYCAYLVHPIIMYQAVSSRRVLIHMTDTEMIYQFLGNLVLAYMTAFVTSLAFESPMLGLEKIIFHRNKRTL